MIGTTVSTKSLIEQEHSSSLPDLFIVDQEALDTSLNWFRQLMQYANEVAAREVNLTSANEQ